MISLGNRENRSMLGITLEGENPRRSQRLYERHIPANLILELWLEDGSKRFLVEGQPIDLLCSKAGALPERTAEVNYWALLLYTLNFGSGSELSGDTYTYFEVLRLKACYTIG